MNGWRRHCFPALAALSLVVGGPHRERFDVTHGLRVVWVLALAASLMFAGRLARTQWSAAEWAMAAGLAAMAISGALALSPAYALTPLALSIGMFGVALGTASRGDDRPLWLTWLAVAAVAVAGLGLLESLGVGPPSLRGRAPSATMGQRNALAHFLVLASPVIWAQAINTQSRRARLGWTVAAALVAAVIVLTRCRAAWLVGPTTFACFALLVRRPALAVLPIVSAAAISILTAAPLQLQWTTHQPFADTWSRLVEFRSGSGAGRLTEWVDSFRLVLAEPLLGVGPGNWFVRYGLTHGNDHFAHSDWIALAVERGALGVLLALVVALAVLSDWKKRTEITGWPVVASTIFAAIGLGAFDAVLQLPAPLLCLTLVCFVGIRRSTDIVRAPRVGVALALLALLFAASFGSRLLSTAESTPFDRLELAASLDPFDGELRLTLSEAWISAGRCDLARPHLRAANRLLPASPQLAAFATSCP